MVPELKLTPRDRKLIGSARTPAMPNAKPVPRWLSVVAIVSGPFIFALLFARMDVIVNVLESAGVGKIASILAAYKPLIEKYQWHFYTCVLLLYVLLQASMIERRDQLIKRMLWHIDRLDKHVRKESGD